MKYLILVGDGMGDLPLAELQGRTPLEAADTPAMDFLCRHGELFRTRTIPEGYPPGSDVANLSLLGYRPEECYTGRAPLEAASLGVELGENEIACRCNLVTLDRSSGREVIMRDYSAGHITTEEARILVETLERELGNEKIRFHAGVGYRHLLVFRGDLGDLATVPPHDYTGRDVGPFRERYLAIPELAELLPRAEAILADHPVNRQRLAVGKNPANSIWLWGEGRPPVMETIPTRYGISGALISAVDLLKGLGVCAGLDIIRVEGATGYLDTNYQGKAEAALKALVDHDLVFVHVEAPDEAGHQGLLREKIRAIEDFDQRIVGPIHQGLARLPGRPDFRLVVAMDHFTPISLRTHTALPVPTLLFDSRKTGPGCGLTYTEKNGAENGSILENGEDFFRRLLERR